MDQNEARSHQILDALPVAVYTTDAVGKITYYNQAAAELGWAKAEDRTKTNGASPSACLRRTVRNCRTTNVPWQSPSKKPPRS